LTLWRADPLFPAMKGKICLVTGATAGIGKVTALELARMGATVVAVGRDPEKGKATVEEVKAGSGSSDVHLMLCDFSSQAAIRKLAAEYKGKFDRLDVLVNNAGAILGERKLTVDGIEATFATNHLGYFLLTNLLLDVIVASGPARIVSVASDAHRVGKIDFDDLQYERRSYSSMDVYGASKLANIVWSAELSRRLEGKNVTANSLHPGVIASSFGQSGGALLRFGMKVVGPFLLSPAKGAATTIHLASSPEVEGVTGQYFRKKKAVTPAKQARDPETGKRLWAISEELTAKSA
jgi:NAD(P)-dependent dehydrogenase (short-subunit alcohol dehydrogenase family)